MDDIDEARDWQGNEIDCGSCRHQALEAEGQLPPQTCLRPRPLRPAHRPLLQLESGIWPNSYVAASAFRGARDRGQARQRVPAALAARRSRGDGAVERGATPAQAAGAAAAQRRSSRGENSHRVGPRRRRTDADDGGSGLLRAAGDRASYRALPARPHDGRCGDRSSPRRGATHTAGLAAPNGQRFRMPWCGWRSRSGLLPICCRGCGTIRTGACATRWRAGSGSASSRN